MANKRLLLSAVLALSAAAPLRAGQRVEHRNPTFSINVPDDFVRLEDTEGFLFAFSAQRGENKLAISAKDAGVPIGLELLELSDLPPDPTVSARTVEHLPLGDTKVNVLTGRFSMQNSQFFTMMAGLPLPDRGVSLIVAGPAAGEQDIREVMTSILASFEGDLLKPGSPEARGLTIRRLPVRERLILLAWTVPLLLGWGLLLAYLPLRLGLIGRGDALLRLRSVWLAVCVVCLIGGSALRIMFARDATERALGWMTGGLSVLVALLVAMAQGRLARRRRESAQAAAQPQAIAPTPE